MALSIGQLAAITQSHIVPKAVEQVFGSNPLLFRLKEKGIKYDGSLSIKQPLVYATTTATTAYSGYDILPTAPNDQITAAEFNWRQYATTVTVSSLEELKNSGKEGILGLMELKKEVASLTLEDTLGTDLQGSNTGGKSIDGLGLLFTAAGVYGGIDPADLSQWEARAHTLITANTLAKLDIQRMIGAPTVGADKPTVGVTRQSVFDKMWALWEGQQRFEDTKMADAGFQNIRVNGVPVVVDSHVAGSDGGSTDNVLMFLNERYLNLFIHKDWNFKVTPIPPQRDQSLKMVRIEVVLNLACSRRNMHVRNAAINPNL